MTSRVWLQALRRRSDAAWLLRHGYVGELKRSIGIRLHSRTVSIGVRRDVEVPWTARAPRIDVEVRPLWGDDDLSFLDPTPEMSGPEVTMCLGLRRLARVAPEHAWIAVAPGNTPCYIQWFIPYTDPSLIGACWGSLFPTLRPGEALIEGAYLARTHRGNGIMAYAIDRIAREAREAGIQCLLGYVKRDNIASLKSCLRAGLAPYAEREEVWSLFRRRVYFRPIAPGVPVARTDTVSGPAVGGVSANPG